MLTLRDYQRNYLKHLMDHRLSIYLACRQCGKTTTLQYLCYTIYCLMLIKMHWYLVINVKLLSKFLIKLKRYILSSHTYLKPGIYKWNEGEIVLDNGCRLMAEATTINSGISFTFHCVLADEFAHIQPTLLRNSITTCSQQLLRKARFMINITQNGYNLFCRLYKGCRRQVYLNMHFKTDWNEVPEWNPDKRCWEKRDEDWHQLQVSQLWL